VTERGDLVAWSGGVSLAGSIWLPEGEAAATVLMHPGSGPSDRDNDGYFPPIREHLLRAGYATCSFDKRGVGGSSGRWQDAGITEQADDVLACLRSLAAEPEVPKPIGLFGHSQGGWVVVEAAGRRPEIAFVIANSGPGVTPGEQERHAHRTYLNRSGVDSDELHEALERWDELMSTLRRGTPFAAISPSLASDRLQDVYRRRRLIVFPDDEELWDFLARIFDYEPREALRRIEVPVLALFGSDDPLVPVEESVTAYREAAPPELLTVAVFPGADHRILVGDPPELAEGYADTLTAFLAQTLGGVQRAAE
jgi:uncharacterized protein